jgi:hypothetical protein
MPRIAKLNCISRIMSSGVWPALPLTGYWLLRSEGLYVADAPLPLITLFAIWSLTGIVVWSGLLLSTAAARCYRGDFLGLAGWLVVSISLVAVFQSGPVQFSLANTWTTWDFVLTIGLCLAGGLYLGFPRECILTGNDMAVYANHGIYIAQHGRLDLAYPWHGVDPALADDLKKHSPHKSKFFQTHVFLGFQKNGQRLTAEFGHVWPVWLAQAFSTAGAGGLFRLNGVFALLALGAFHGVCLLVVTAPVAVVATVFLALISSQVWIARTTLSEVFNQWAFLVGLLLLLQSLKTGTPSLAAWAGAILAFSALIRCDGFLLFPLLLVAQLAHLLIVQPAECFDSIRLSFLVTAGPGFLLALGYYFFFSRPYFWKQFFYLRLIGLGTVLAITALLIVPRMLGDEPWIWLKTDTTANLLGVVTATLAVYAYWIRPNVIHYRLDWPDHPLHGEPHRAEYSLRDLGRYLSPVVLIASVCGVWISLRDLTVYANPWFLPWVTVATAYALLYLYDPCDDPDHFWRVRRYVPVVIPAFLFFAAVAGNRGRDLLPGTWRGAATAATLVILVGFAASTGIRFWRRSEDAGTWDQLRSLAEMLPRDEIVFVAGRPEWMTPLYVAFGRCVVPLDLDNDSGWELLARGVAAQLRFDKPALLLSDKSHVFFRPTREVGRVVLFRRFLENTYYPVPKRFVTDEITLVLVAIASPIEPPNWHHCAQGGSKVWGVSESGFYAETVSFHQKVRWTNGHGRLEVRVAAEDWPDELMIDLSGSSPSGSHLRVLANGYELYCGNLDEERNWFKILPLSNVRIGTLLSIELISNTFIPADTYKGSNDYRSLGVQVREVRLLSSKPSPFDSTKRKLSALKARVHGTNDPLT